MNTVKAEAQKQKRNNEPSTTPSRVLDPESAIDSVVKKALDTSASRLGLNDSKRCLEQLNKCDSAAFNYYSYYFAKELGELLGSWSKNVKSVYACNYDSSISGEDCLESLPQFSLIHMIVRVEQKNHALNSLLESIDGALVKKHRQVFNLDRLEHALDAQVIDDQDVKNRTGYAAMLNSLYQPPIEIWRSSPGT